MVNDDDAVARRAHVQLDAVGAQFEPVVERGDRVLRRKGRAAPMGEDQHAPRFEKGMTHGTQHLSTQHPEYNPSHGGPHSNPG